VIFWTILAKGSPDAARRTEQVLQNALWSLAHDEGCEAGLAALIAEDLADGHLRASASCSPAPASRPSPPATGSGPAPASSPSATAAPARRISCAVGHALVEAGRRALYTRTTDPVQRAPGRPP
jgi:hypothetical protein